MKMFPVKYKNLITHEIGIVRNHNQFPIGIPIQIIQTNCGPERVVNEIRILKCTQNKD
jgi:hypothetical protein